MGDVMYADGDDRDDIDCRYVDGGINADTATCLLLPILPWSMAIIAAMKRRSMLSSLFFVVSGLRTKLLGGLGAEVTLIQNIYALIYSRDRML